MPCLVRWRCHLYSLAPQHHAFADRTAVHGAADRAIVRWLGQQTGSLAARVSDRNGRRRLAPDSRSHQCLWGPIAAAVLRTMVSLGCDAHRRSGPLGHPSARRCRAVVRAPGRLRNRRTETRSGRRLGDPALLLFSAYDYGRSVLHDRAAAVMDSRVYHGLDSAPQRALFRRKSAGLGRHRGTQ